MTTAQAPAWSGLPTGYFTHERVYDPNPLPNAPESHERMEALESRLFVSGPKSSSCASSATPRRGAS